jgi:membrane protein implicated in regulation of membrane protease activity
MHLFDLRVPLGWLFLILGALLIVSGLKATATSDGVSLAINIDLIWGAVLVVFALVCLWFARRNARKRIASATQAPGLQEPRR